MKTTKSNGEIFGYSITPAGLQWYMRHLAEDLGYSREELVKLSFSQEQSPHNFSN